MNHPTWQWHKVYSTRFWLVRAQSDIGMEQCAAVVDDFGNLILV